MAKSTVAVKFTGDASNLKGTITQVEGKLGGLASKAATAGKAVAVGLGVGIAGGVALGKEVLELGGKLTAWRQKTATVFEGSAKDIRAWADKNNETFGLTDDELAGLAASFGDLLKPMGFTADEAADMSKNVVGLSGALSEWSGGVRTAAEVSEILAKAMLGERDSLKELGISITEADVSARLLAKGQDKLTGSALEQAKALATQELIFEKSTDAQKAYAAGGNDALRASNKLKAGLGEIKERIATGLLPIVAALTTWVADRLPGAMDAAQRAFERAKPHVKAIADEVRDFVTKALDVMSAWWDDNGETVVAAAQALATGVTEAFALVIEAGGFVVEHWDQFKYLAGVMAAAIVAHYVRLGVAAVASAATQAGAWVSMKVAAAVSKAETAAIIALYIAEWVKMAAAAVLNAARVVASWVATQVAARGATTAHGVAVAAQIAGWGTLSAAAARHAAAVAASWAKALGPMAAVIAGAEAINRLTGNKMNPNDLSLWERLDPRKAFDGISVGNPLEAIGGFFSGLHQGTSRWRGGMAVVGEHGKELVNLPAGAQVIPHTRAMAMAGGEPAPIHVTVTLDGRVVGEVLANRAAVDDRNRGRR